MKLLFTFILISSVCFGQSKKEQIEGLNKTIDSLNTVLTTTRDDSAKDISSLNDKIKEISDEVTALKSDLTNLQTSNVKLTKENDKLTNENDKLKTDLGELSKKNLELEAKLKAILVEKTSFKTVKIGNLEVMTEDLGVWFWDNAKKACADLGDGWRLPTKDELNILYENKDKIGGFAEGFTYWSSTESDNFYAWRQDFYNGYQLTSYKLGGNNVRAVRAF
jgi:regulator of replication initiation timing